MPVEDDEARTCGALVNGSNEALSKIFSTPQRYFLRRGLGVNLALCLSGVVRGCHNVKRDGLAML